MNDKRGSSSRIPRLITSSNVGLRVNHRRHYSAPISAQKSTNVLHSDSDRESGYAEQELLRSISNEHFAIANVSTQTEQHAAVLYSYNTDDTTQTFIERYDPGIYDIMATEATRNIVNQTASHRNTNGVLIPEASNNMPTTERFLIDQDCTVGLTDYAKSDFKNIPPLSNMLSGHNMDSNATEGYQPVEVNLFDDMCYDFDSVPAFIDGEQVPNYTDNLSSETVKRQVEIVEHEVNRITHVIKPTTSIVNKGNDVAGSVGQDDDRNLISGDTNYRRKLPILPREACRVFLGNSHDEYLLDSNTEMNNHIITNRGEQSSGYAHPLSNIKINPSIDAHETKSDYLQDYQDYMESFDGYDSVPCGRTTDQEDNCVNFSIRDNVIPVNTSGQSVHRDIDTLKMIRGIKHEGNKEATHMNEQRRHASAVHSPEMDNIFVNITNSESGEHSRSVTTIRQMTESNEHATTTGNNSKKGSLYLKKVPYRPASGSTVPPWRYNRRVSTRDETIQTVCHNATQTPLRVQLCTYPYDRVSLLDTLVFESDCDINSSHPIGIMPWNIIGKTDLDDMNLSKDFSTQTFGQPDHNIVATGTQTGDDHLKQRSTDRMSSVFNTDVFISNRRRKQKRHDSASSEHLKSNRSDILKYMLCQVRELKNELAPECKPHKKQKEIINRENKKNDELTSDVEYNSDIDALDEDPDKYTKRRLELLYETQKESHMRSPGRSKRRYSVGHNKRERHYRSDIPDSNGHRDDVHATTTRINLSSARRNITPPPRSRFVSPTCYDSDRHVNYNTPSHSQRPFSYSHGTAQPILHHHAAYRQSIDHPHRHASQYVPSRPIVPLQLHQNATFRPIQNQLAYQSVPPTPVISTPFSINQPTVTQSATTPLALLPSGQIQQILPQSQHAAAKPYIMITSPYRYDSESNIDQQRPKSKGKRSKTPMEISLHNATRAAYQMRDITDNIKKKQS